MQSFGLLVKVGDFLFSVAQEIVDTNALAEVRSYRPKRVDGLESKPQLPLQHNVVRLQLPS